MSDQAGTNANVRVTSITLGEPVPLEGISMRLLSTITGILGAIAEIFTWLKIGPEELKQHSLEATVIATLLIAVSLVAAFISWRQAVRARAARATTTTTTRHEIHIGFFRYVFEEIKVVQLVLVVVVVDILVRYLPDLRESLEKLGRALPFGR